MASPYSIDTALQTLISGTVAVPVYKSAFVPSLDINTTPNGYVFFDIDEMFGYHSSEGMAGEDGLEIANFRLDIACAAHSNAQRKALVTSVLSVLQPVVSGIRTQLTSYLIGTTGVFINYLRLESQTETSVVKTGQSTPDISLIVLSFSGKATC